MKFLKGIPTKMYDMIKDQKRISELEGKVKELEKIIEIKKRDKQ